MTLHAKTASSDGQEGSAIAEFDSHIDASMVDQFLTFIVEDEEYGVDILCVQEIRGWEPATPLPNAPEHIKGVINLRGTIIPVIDLRTCFGLKVVEYTPITVVIVLKVVSQAGDRTVGIVVDAVSDVFTLKPENLQPAPDLGETVTTEFIKGLANINEKMVILLDIDALLKLDEIPDLSTIKSQLS